MGLKVTTIKVKPTTPTNMTLSEIEDYIDNSETDYNGFYAASGLRLCFKEGGVFTISDPTSTDFWTDSQETFNVHRFCIIDIVEE